MCFSANKPQIMRKSDLGKNAGIFYNEFLSTGIPAHENDGSTFRFSYTTHNGAPAVRMDKVKHYGIGGRETYVVSAIILNWIIHTGITAHLRAVLIKIKLKLAPK